MILLDIAKAFDRLWHNGLIYKMIEMEYPQPIIRIINSNLRGREIKVTKKQDKHEKGDDSYKNGGNVHTDVYITNWIKAQENICLRQAINARRYHTKHGHPRITRIHSAH